MLKYAELYKEEAKELIVNEKLVSKQSEHQSEYGHSKVHPYHDAKSILIMTLMSNIFTDMIVGG